MPTIRSSHPTFEERRSIVSETCTTSQQLATEGRRRVDGSERTRARAGRRPLARTTGAGSGGRRSSLERSSSRSRGAPARPVFPRSFPPREAAVGDRNGRTGERPRASGWRTRSSFETARRTVASRRSRLRRGCAGSDPRAPPTRRTVDRRTEGEGSADVLFRSGSSSRAKGRACHRRVRRVATKASSMRKNPGWCESEKELFSCLPSSSGEPRWWP